jgi:hypothetical protein
MPREGFEPAIPVTKSPQTYALDRAATGKWLHPYPVSASGYFFLLLDLLADLPHGLLHISHLTGSRCQTSH